MAETEADVAHNAPQDNTAFDMNLSKDSSRPSNPRGRDLKHKSSENQLASLPRPSRRQSELPRKW